MKKFIFTLLVSLHFIFASSDSSAVTPYITDPEIKIVDNNITVKTSIADINDLEPSIHSGVGKEIIFTLELMRAWNFWPDEFVVSKKIRNVLRYDNLRNFYIASSRDGATRIDRRFTDFSAMKTWISFVNSVAVANIKELEPGSYYIRIIVETKSREQLPLAGLWKYLVPEVEKSLAKESRPFSISGKPGGV